MPAECLPRVHVGKMHFDEGQRNAEDGIAQRDAGVGEGAGVQDQELDALRLRLLHGIDQLMLGIALAGGELVAQVPRQRGAARNDGVQGVRAVESRFAGAQQVQVGPVQKQQPRH